MAGKTWHEALPGPAAIAIHDDGDVARDIQTNPFRDLLQALCKEASNEADALGEQKKALESMLPGGVLLALEDADNRDMFGVARVLVLAFPAKVLRTPPQLHSADSPARVGSRLCDMAQQARYQQKRGKTMGSEAAA